MYKNSIHVSNEDIKKVKFGIQISQFYWCVWGLIIDLKGSDVDFDYKQFVSTYFLSLLITETIFFIVISRESLFLQASMISAGVSFLSKLDKSSLISSDQ